tara:strand:- start:569 stop:1018 length:450 start_codon:yes stop_codon:yes gene_type:complete
MPSQQKLDQTYMDMAECWSTLSKAVRKKVGCLIVKDGTIISDGYNGTPSGFDNTCELQGPSETLITKPEVLHAESNAISKLAKSTQSSDGATLYATCSPCLECSKLIIQSGISRVVYGEKYRSDQGLELLKRAGINISFIKWNDLKQYS